MAAHQPLEELDYEGLPGQSLAANLAAGAFAGIMVRALFFPSLVVYLLNKECFSRSILLCIPSMLSRYVISMECETIDARSPKGTQVGKCKNIMLR